LLGEAAAKSREQQYSAKTRYFHGLQMLSWKRCGAMRSYKQGDDPLIGDSRPVVEQPIETGGGRNIYEARDLQYKMWRSPNVRAGFSQGLGWPVGQPYHGSEDLMRGLGPPL
jgi:hypothetical protein